MSLFHISTPRSDTTLQTDASNKGLGAVILQDSKPVMFTSRALTGAEKNYPKPAEGMLSKQSGVWRNFIIFSMVNISRLRLIRSL